MATQRKSCRKQEVLKESGWREVAASNVNSVRFEWKGLKWIKRHYSCVLSSFAKGHFCLSGSLWVLIEHRCISRSTDCSHKEIYLVSNNTIDKLWHSNRDWFVLSGPKCAKKTFLMPLHHHQQPGLLAQGRLGFMLLKSSSATSICYFSRNPDS